jgi:two-component system response regulator LytT
MNKPINCIIVEDEEHAASFLEDQLKKAHLNVYVQAKFDTVEESVKWLYHNTIDLIFMDIQLGDGLSFEIFDHIQLNTPIVFITSYNQYAIKAFDQNSIAYLLKPVKQSELIKAISKFEKLYFPNQSFNNPFKGLHQSYQQKFMVYIGNVMQTITANDIAYFKLQEKRYLFVVTNQQAQYMYDSSLELLESRLNPDDFFRINRQFIVSKKNILQLKQLDRGRFMVVTNPASKDDLIVSIGRSKSFKTWFNN